jgi:hypothetical protein
MIHKYNNYWRSMVKDALGCDDDYADILLNYQYTVSNGIDSSEATTAELNKYWRSIHKMYQEDQKEKSNVN